MNIATEFNEFNDTLFNKKILRHKMRRIQAKKHKLGTYEVNKISLSCFDDKTICYEKEEILTDKKDSKNFHKKKRFSRTKRIKKDFS